MYSKGVDTFESLSQNPNSLNSERITEVDIDNIYNFSLAKMKNMYTQQFIGSRECKQLIYELNNNIIEFRLL